VAQPPTISNAAVHMPRDVRKARSESMEWFLLEAGVALLLAIFIVWWLMRGKK
jgi:hypothetical protein